MTVLLRRKGWEVNKKAVQRLWALAGLNVPKRKRIRRHPQGPYSHLKASRPREIWCYDFVQDRTKDGRAVRMLNVLDEYTRECLALEADRTFKAEDVIDVLEVLVWKYGAPTYLRSDNGPEFVAKKVKDWLAEAGIQTAYIEPGCPWENAHVESFNGKFRDECLDMEDLGSLEECQVLSARYKWDYNFVRPHSSIGNLPPAVFAAKVMSGGPGLAGTPMVENRA